MKVIRVYQARRFGKLKELRERFVYQHTNYTVTWEPTIEQWGSRNSLCV